jgi:signal transduction histidine kinase
MLLKKSSKLKLNITNTQLSDIFLYVLLTLWLALSTQSLNHEQILTLILASLCAIALNSFTIFAPHYAQNNLGVRLMVACIATIPFILLCSMTGGVLSPYNSLLISYCIVRLIRTRLVAGKMILVYLFCFCLFSLIAFKAWALVYGYLPKYVLFNQIEAFVQSVRQEPLAVLFSLITGLAYIAANVYFTEKSSTLNSHDMDRSRILRSMDSILLYVDTNMNVKTCIGSVEKFFSASMKDFDKIFLTSHVHTDDQILLRECVQNITPFERIRLRILALGGNFRWVECKVLSRSRPDQLVELMFTPCQYQDAHEEVDIDQKARADLLANMSHELRTPLNAVIGFSEILQNEVFGSLGSEKNAEYVRMIHDSGYHMLCLINELLDLTHIESLRRTNDYTAPVLNWISVDALIKECVQLTAHRMKPMGGKINYEPMEEEDFNFLSDRVGLKQIIRALLMAALLKDGHVHYVNVRAKRLHTTLKITVRTKICNDSQESLQHSKHSLTYMSSLNLDIAMKFVEGMSGHVSILETDENGEGCITLSIPHRRPSKFFGRNIYRSNIERTADYNTHTNRSNAG